MADIPGSGDNLHDNSVPPAESLSLSALGSPGRISDSVSDAIQNVLPPLDGGLTRWMRDPEMEKSAQQFAGSFSHTYDRMPRSIN